MACTACCLATFQCPEGGPQLKKVAGESKGFPSAVYAPFVSLKFIQVPNGEPTFQPADTTPTVTVGNMSSPQINNHAVIKSFTYGTGAPGHTEAKVEIYDEEGSEFSIFMDNLNSTIEAEKTVNVLVDFGWILQRCNGAINMVRASDTLGPLYFMPLQVTATYENGKIKFTVELVDLIHRMAENRVSKPEGSDTHKKTLKDAIRDLCSQNKPSIANVEFVRQTASGPQPIMGFMNEAGTFGADGPLSAWPTNNQDVPTIIRDWISQVKTDQGKGMVMGWNPSKASPTLTIWEDPGPDCDQPSGPCTNNLGTYIVNGGDCSPVISFNPSTKWMFVPRQGGAISADGQTKKEPTDNDGGAQPDPTEVCRQKNKGGQSQPAGGPRHIVPGQNESQWMPPGAALGAKQDAANAHEKAVRITELKPLIPIECDLKIQGDPSYAHPTLMTGKKVSLIVINPFYISGKCPNTTWLSQPVCNSVFSSRDWMINQVSHEIREGSFTTTLKLVLTVPPSQNTC